VRGRGADIFHNHGGDDPHEGEQSRQDAGTRVQQSTTQKATSYLEPEILNRLEDAWIADRRRHPRAKVSKSAIVGASLATYLAKKESSAR